MASRFVFYELRQRLGSRDISVLFSGWEPGRERVMVLSPHDDDALLGAGYAMAASRACGAEVYVCILCDGSAGYSREEQRATIVEVRKREALNAYRVAGVPEDHVVHLGFPDFSLVSYIGWRLSAGCPGTLARVIPLLRKLGITRLMIPNGYREHTDHEAAYDVGRYDGVQAGDPVLADHGAPCAIKSTTQYAVWGDFSPEDAVLAGADLSIRANRAIVADYGVEEEVARALAQFGSQGQIIQGLIEQRRARDCGAGMMELYIAMDPRPRLEYAPYARAIRSIQVK
jgi:LmbE family N-acetylglucosaminyl deacetylase